MPSPIKQTPPPSNHAFSASGGGGSLRDGWPTREPAAHTKPVASKVKHLFKVELDLAELDERRRPGPAWAGKGAEISRATLCFRSRRMCYEGREILAAVHLIDDQPVVLAGRVVKCEYDGEGLYRTEVELMPMPDNPTAKGWNGQNVKES